MLTAAGRRAYDGARPRYAEAVRTMILDGLDDAGVADLADLTLAILRRLDPEGRLAVTASCAADPAVGPAPAPSTADAACPADPAP